jgi:hypothetical protein
MSTITWTTTIRGNLPLHPITICSGIRIIVIASRTLVLVILKDFLLPQHNAHLEHHSCFHRIGELRRVDDLAIFGMYHCIVTPLHQLMTSTTFTEAADDGMKILQYRGLVRRNMRVKLSAYLPRRTKYGRNRDVAPQVIHDYNFVNLYVAKRGWSLL